MNVDWRQALMAGLGAFGFALVFNIRGKKLALATLGGLLSWTVYLILMALRVSEWSCYLAASAFSSVYAEIMARAAKAPATVFYVPAVIPLVPGASLFYAMNSMLSGDWQKSAASGAYTVSVAAAIAGGILIVMSLSSVPRAFARAARKRNPPKGC